jgi:SAM-dependent methyltransferase
MMKRNPILTFKVSLFRLIRPLEAVYAYNRKRRDNWMKYQSCKIPEGSKVLDVGAGGCPHRKLFSHCQYFTQDFVQLSDNQIQDQLGYGRIDFVSDILDIPVESESFDAVLCTEVIEHVPDPISALREMSRILKPGGTLLISAPLQSGLHQEPFHFYGGYTKYWYEKFLTENNFVDLVIEPNGSLYTTHFSLGLTIVKKFLEVVLLDKRLIHKAVSVLSLVIFAPFFLIVNPLFSFYWERLFGRDEFTAGYHVVAKKCSGV